MKALLRYLSGYVRIELTGYATERFLNLCTNHNIYIWNMKHQRDGSYVFCMGVQDFFTIRPLVKKTKTKIRVKNKRGLPFFLYRYRKRKLFLFGFLIGAGMIYLFSCYVWNVEICGNSVLSDDTVYRYLETEQISVGAKKKNIDCEKLESDIRQYFPNVIWTSVRLEGTKLTVDIKENLVIEEEKEQDEKYQDLIADKKGVIKSIITRNGVPKVKVGDKVKKGTILVSGRIDILNDAGEVTEYQYCKADADIIAQTTYSYEYRVPKTIEKKVYTEKEKNRYAFWYDKKYFELPARKISYRFYEKETEKKQFQVMKNFYLPFYWQKDTYKEYQKKNYNVSKKQAKDLAAKDLELFLSKLEEKGVQIIEKNVMMDTEKNEYVFKGTLTACEKFESYQDTEQKEVPKEEGTVENESE